MGLVTIEHARPGMVLAAHVTDRRGRLLIPAEARLSERHVEALRMWGVTHLRIEDQREPSVVTEEIDEATLSEITSDVDEHFVNVDLSHPLIATLHECVVDRRTAAWALTRTDP